MIDTSMMKTTCRILVLLVVLCAKSQACDELLVHSSDLYQDLQRASAAGDLPEGQIRPGDIVNLGARPGQSYEFELVDSKGPYVFSFDAPYPVRLLEILPGRQAKIEFLDNGEVSTMPIYDFEVYSLPDVARARLLKKIRSLKSEPLDFSIGERVRYRDLGLMKSGVVSGFSGNKIFIDGRSVDRRRAFKLVGASPSTMLLDLKQRYLKLGVPSGLGLIFLDRVARWTSRQDFRRLLVRDQLRLLAQLTVAMNPWHRPTSLSDQKCNLTFTDLLFQGVGLCRHLNPMTAALIAEVGYPARLMSFHDHTWVEVHAPRGDGGHDTWIVESSLKSFSDKAIVVRLDDLEKGKVSPRPALADAYYLHPERTEEF